MSTPFSFGDDPFAREPLPPPDPSADDPAAIAQARSAASLSVMGAKAGANAGYKKETPEEMAERYRIARQTRSVDDDLLTDATKAVKEAAFARLAGEEAPASRAQREQSAQLLKEINAQAQADLEARRAEMNQLEEQIKSFGIPKEGLDLSPILGITDALYGTGMTKQYSDTVMSPGKAQEVKLNLLKDLSRQKSELQRDSLKSRAEVIKSMAPKTDTAELLRQATIVDRQAAKEVVKRREDSRKQADDAAKRIAKLNVPGLVQSLDLVEEMIPGGLDNFDAQKGIPGVGADRLLGEPILGYDFFKQLSTTDANQFRSRLAGITTRLLRMDAGTAQTFQETFNTMQKLNQSMFSSDEDVINGLRDLRTAIRTDLDANLVLDPLALEEYLQRPNSIAPDHPTLVPKPKNADKKKAILDRIKANQRTLGGG